VTAAGTAFLLLSVQSLAFETQAETPQGVTSLTNAGVHYEVPDAHYVVLSRDPVKAVVVDNAPVDDEELPGHRAGYHGLAKLTHRSRSANIFVPSYSGLNFEHIHDGTTHPREILFEPRNAPMQLRHVDAHIVELYQPPTPTWQLESCLRYELLADGVIELTIECIPRRDVYRNNYIGLFFASYIHQPESGAIHLHGRRSDQTEDRWHELISPKHGVRATHLAITDERRFAHANDFPLTLVFNRSDVRYSRPWYYGVSNGMALAYVFRSVDGVRFAQSPSGGGQGNPAWDFQYFLQPVEVGRRYQLVMRLVYVPFTGREQPADIVEPHLRSLNGS